MADILISALLLFLIIILGQALKLLGVFKQEDVKLLSTIVLNITLPCAVVNSVSSIAFDASFLTLTLLGVGANAVLSALALLAARKRGGGDKAFYMLNLCGYNIGCFGLPFLQTFSGPTAVVAGCFFDAGNAVMAMGVNYGLASAIADGQRRSPRDMLLSFLKKLGTSGPFVAYFLVFTFILMGFTFPARVLEFTGIVGGANVFLSMLMIGISMDLHMDREQVKRAVSILSLRTAASVLFAALFYLLAPFTPEINKTMMLCVFAPISSMAPVLTARCGGDARLAGTINSCSILISILFMTLVAIGI